MENKFTKTKFKNGFQYYKDEIGDVYYDLGDGKIIFNRAKEDGFLGFLYKIFIGLPMLILIYVTFPIWIWGYVIIMVFKSLTQSHKD